MLAVRQSAIRHDVNLQCDVIFASARVTHTGRAVMGWDMALSWQLGNLLSDMMSTCNVRLSLSVLECLILGVS